ncbi:hypothetical protein ACVILI_000917 [Mesorhizobium sp. USDA 4775]
MRLKVPVPDHTTLSRRAQKWEPSARRNPPLPDGPLHVLVDSTGLKVYGAGQWLEQKHATRSRRNWRKLHLAVDAKSGAIIAQRLTDQDTDDPSQVALVHGSFVNGLAIGRQDRNQLDASCHAVQTQRRSSSSRGKDEIQGDELA